MKDLYDEWIDPNPIPQDRLLVSRSPLPWNAPIELWQKYQGQFYQRFRKTP